MTFEKLVLRGLMILLWHILSPKKLDEVDMKNWKKWIEDSRKYLNIR
jgi:hypothetical protein